MFNSINTTATLGTTAPTQIVFQTVVAETDKTDLHRSLLWIEPAPFEAQGIEEEEDEALFEEIALRLARYDLQGYSYLVPTSLDASTETLMTALKNLAPFASGCASMDGFAISFQEEGREERARMTVPSIWVAMTVITIEIEERRRKFTSATERNRIEDRVEHFIQNQPKDSPYDVISEIEKRDIM